MLDFEIEISSGEGGSYRVAARSPAGDVSDIPVRFPFDELALERQLQAVELALLRSVATMRQLVPAEEQPVRQFGRQLFEFAFPPELRAHLSASRQQAAQEATPLRVRLRVGPAELAALPWEFLYDPSRDEYLCLSTPLVRYLDVLEPRRPLTVTPPLRILGMVALPDDLDPLNVDHEKRRLQQALAALEQAGRVQLVWVEGQTWWDLQRFLDQGSWHIVHFVGHGGFSREAGEGVLALAGEDGRVHQLGANDLALLFAEHRSLRLVVLNSCDSARASATDRFSSTAAVLIRRGIPAVVAMQYAISDQAAITFARGFYTAIAAQHPVDLAVTRARRAVKLDRGNSLEWATPVLYLRSSHGDIFDLTDTAAPPEPIPAPSEPMPAKLRAHFEPRARGWLPFGALSGWYFCGRVRALSEIVGWLNDANGGDARARLVTGRPGSGKTAVLGRLVVMSYPELRSRVPPGEIAHAPAETVCPLGAIHSLVHARGLTVDEVAAAVAREVGIEARDSETLLLALSDRKPSPPLGVVVDAVDEAAAPARLVRELLAPLARIAEQAGVRLVVGTRPGQDRRLVRAFGRNAVEIDLDSATYLEAEDLIDYAERLLLAVGEDESRGRSRGILTPYRLRPELAPTVARAVAARAGRSFLVAHLASLALAQAPDVLDTAQPGWETTLPHSADEAMEQYLDRFQTDRARVRDLLTPLAFAEGDGIGDPDVWARLATALGTASYTAADVAWLLSDTTAPDLLTRGEAADGVTGTVTYRLFHEALAEYLRAALTSRMSVEAVSRAFAAVLVNAVPTRPDGAGRQWTKADHYTRMYLSVHAAAGGVFDDLVCDLSFIAVAEPSRLLQALPAVTSAEGRRVAETLTRVGRQLLLFPERQRLSYLELAARKSGDSQLADRVSDVAPGRPWSVPWACWAAPASGRTIGHHGHYIVGLSLMSLGGRPIVAAADRTGIRLWDPQTASAVRELVDPGLADICTMTTTSTDTGPRVVTGHADGTVAFWNPVTGSCAVREVTSGWTIVTSLGHDLIVSEGTGANLTLWRASDATLVAGIAIPSGMYLCAAGRVDDIDLAILLHEENRTVHLWNLTKREAVGEPLVLHEKATLWSCAFGVVNGASVVFTGIATGSGSYAGSSVRDVVSWPATRQTLPDAGWGPHSAALTSTAEQTVLSIGGADSMLRRFTWTDDRFVLTSKVTAHDSDITKVTFWNHNGRTVEITGGRDGAVRTWQALHSDSPTEAWPYLWRHSHVLAETDTDTLLVGPDRDGRLNRWDAATGDDLGALPGLSERAASGTVYAMTACRIGDRPVVVAGYDDGWIAILDLNAGVLIDELVVSDSAVVALRVAPPPGAPVVVCASADGAISCYDLDQATWITRGARLYDSGGVELDTTHLDGRRIAVTLGCDIKDSHATLRLWDIDAGAIANETLATLDVGDRFGPAEGYLWNLAAGHADGRAIAVWMGAGFALRVWDLRSGELIKTGFVEDGHQMASHHVSIDRLHGRDAIISGGHAGALSIWNLSGTIRTIEFGHSASAWHVIPPDSLIVGGPMGILKLRLTPDFLMEPL